MRMQVTVAALVAAVLSLVLDRPAAHGYILQHYEIVGTTTTNSGGNGACGRFSGSTFYQFYFTYTDSKQTRGHARHWFLLVGANEAPPERVTGEGTLEIVRRGLATAGGCWVCTCNGATTSQQFVIKDQTTLQRANYGFRSITYSEYASRVTALGGTPAADAYAAYGYLVSDLDVAPGSSSITNMSSGNSLTGACDASCPGFTFVNTYESRKEFVIESLRVVPVEVCGDGLDNDGNGRAEESCGRGGGLAANPVPGGSGAACGPSNSAKTGSSCELASGALTETLPLLAVPGGPLPLSLTASYSSLDPTVGVPGRGWTHSYASRLTQDVGYALTLVDEFGTYRTYRREGPDTYVPVARGGPRDRIVKAADGSYTRHFPGGSRWRFDTTGRLLELQDRNGQTTTLTYTSGVLTRIANPAGHAIDLTYDPGTGHLAQLDDSAGRTVSLGYSGDGLTSLVDAAGGSWVFTYDAAGRMATKSDPRQATWTYGYDAAGRLSQVTDPATITRQFVYDPATTTTRVVEADGATTIQKWDGTRNVPLEVTDPSGRKTTYTWDAVGNLLTRKDAATQTWTYTYDAEGRILTATDPLNRTTTYTYDPATGQVATRREPDQALTQFVYDAWGNLTRAVDSTSRETRFGYDTLGRLTTITDPANQVTTLAYNAQHQVTTVTDPTSVTVSFTYDAVGRLATVTEAGGATTTYAYDALSRLVSVTDPLTHVTSTGYDGRGHPTSRTDALGG